MALKRSGRVLIVTIITLLIFSLLVIWHNKPPHSNTPERIQIELDNLIQKYPDLGIFVKRLKLTEDRFAFFSLGLRGQQFWPTNLSSACYSDPLAVRGQFGPLKDSYSGQIEAIRYRSLEDFILILQKAESEQPGFIDGLDLKAHRPLPEDPVGISIGLVFAICIGITGLWVVRKTAQ